MSDYATALQAGLDAAKEAQTARREIKGVFDELAREVRDALRGQVAVRIAARQRWPRRFFLDLRYEEEPKRYDAIVAFRVGDEKKEDAVLELATWRAAEYGYPVTIEWEGETHTCHDRESLARCLAELLKAPSVGEAFLRLMPAPVPEAASTLKEG